MILISLKEANAFKVFQILAQKAEQGFMDVIQGFFPFRDFFVKVSDVGLMGIAL